MNRLPGGAEKHALKDTEPDIPSLTPVLPARRGGGRCPLCVEWECAILNRIDSVGKVDSTDLGGGGSMLTRD